MRARVLFLLSLLLLSGLKKVKAVDRPDFIGPKITSQTPTYSPKHTPFPSSRYRTSPVSEFIRCKSAGSSLGVSLTCCPALALHSSCSFSVTCSLLVQFLCDLLPPCTCLALNVQFLFLCDLLPCTCTAHAVSLDLMLCTCFALLVQFLCDLHLPCAVRAVFFCVTCLLPLSCAVRAVFL